MNEVPMQLVSRGIPGLKPMLLLIGVAAAVALGVVVVMWSQEPTYEMLYRDVDDASAREVVAALKSANIKYRFEGSSTLMVQADKIREARMELAGKDLLGAEGLAQLDKDPGFGVSQFMENVRYQKALASELASNIKALQQVEDARVVLAVPQQSVFTRDRKPVSASVTVKLRTGARLDREAVAAIVNLVASGIPGLAADLVTVVDTQGRLLNSPDKNSEFAIHEQQLELAQRMEEDYAQRIESMLAPLLGPGRVRAQVKAQIEMSSTEEAREQYGPESQVVRSEQTSEEASRSGAGPQGVPGALTNQPPQGGTALPPGAGAPVQAGATTEAAQAATATANAPDNTSRQATRNYEIDRTVAYTRQPAGRLQRLTVAVLIDNLRTTDADGKVTETPLSDAQIANINTLVRDAVGFDEVRGDRVSVINQSFLPEVLPEEPEAEGTPIWQQPLVKDIAKLLAGLVLVLLLILMVLRPLVRSILAAGKTMLEQPIAMPAGPALANLAEAGGPMGRGGPSMAYEQQIAQARSLVSKDPARVAQVVRDWVQKDE